MFPDWIFIALLAPALWSVVILIDDNFASKVYENPFVGTIITGFFSLVPLLSLFFIPITIPSIQVICIAIIAGLVRNLAYWLYFKSLTIELPSVVTAIWMLAPAIMPFLAFFFLKEVLSFSEIIGFCIILIASISLSLINVRKLKITNAFYLMGFTSLLTASSAIMEKYVYQQVDFWSGFMFFSIGMGMSAFFLSICFKDGRNFIQDFGIKYRRYIPIFIVSEVLNVAAILATGFAVSKASVSLVRVLEGLQPIFILLFSLLLYPLFPTYFREAVQGNKVTKILFMMLMLVGLLFISMG